MAEPTGDVDILRRIEDTTLNDQNLARDAKILDDWTTEDSSIRSFLKDRCVFVTGGTGFLGKILVEKLLRTCPEIRAIFLLIRTKKGKKVDQRIEEYFQDAVFQVLRKERRNFRRKIVAIEGDVEQPNLGINSEDLAKIQDQVSVIFHAAATVRFDELLRKTVLVNILGTMKMLKLASTCARLVSYVQFSTAFAFCTRKNIDEKFYDAPMKPGDLIELVEKHSDQELIDMTPGLLGKYPNTYTFSKAVTEDVIRYHARSLPICLFRPSIVIGTYREPLRGWANNFYGPTGILIGAGVGLIRSIYGDQEKVADLIPVDLVANAAIACAWKTYQEGVKSTGPSIYNYVSGSQQPITWGRFCEINRDVGLNIPTVHAVWYYGFKINKNWYIHMLYAIFLQYLPAYIADGVCKLLGKEARLVKAYRKIGNLNKTIKFFVTQEWTYKNQNVIDLWKSLTTADQQLFNFDVDQLDWVRHAETCIMGIRVYLLKDPVSTLPEARAKWRKMKIMHITLKTCFYLLVLYIIGQLFYNIVM